MRRASSRGSIVESMQMQKTMHHIELDLMLQGGGKLLRPVVGRSGR